MQQVFVSLCRLGIALKVDGNEKLGGSKRRVIELQFGIVAIEVYMKFERAVSVLIIYFRFRLLEPYK
jgi:hypothetical protein